MGLRRQLRKDGYQLVGQLGRSEVNNNDEDLSSAGAGWKCLGDQTPSGVAVGWGSMLGIYTISWSMASGNVATRSAEWRYEAMAECSQPR